MAEEGMSFQIEPHALERFQERWLILHGKHLEESDVLPRLHVLIAAAKPEPENDGLAKRNQRYGGQNSYLMNGPWRFVFDGNRLVTIELRRGNFACPRLYKGEVGAKLYLRITEDVDETLIEKSDAHGFSVVVPLVMPKMPEINAIIRFLRLSGAEVQYKRTGTEAYKQAVLEVCLPKEMRRFEKEMSDGRKVWLLFKGREGPYVISGIAPEDYEVILDFVVNQEDLKRARRAMLEEQEKERAEKIAEKRKRRRERRQWHKEEKAEESPEPSKLPISEILTVSSDPIVVWGELWREYPERIHRQECKLGKTWVLHYRFLAPAVEISVSIRDAISLEDGRESAISQLISKLRDMFIS